MKTSTTAAGARTTIAAPKPGSTGPRPAKNAGRKGSTSHAASPANRRKVQGIDIARHYTATGTDPLDAVSYEQRSSIITNPDGSVVFKMEAAEVPVSWSQLATDIALSKYFRRAGLFGDKTRGETSVRQVVHRIAHTIRQAGEAAHGYFATPADADTFEAELAFLLVNQYGAFNSPVWFNCGLFHQYEIEGSGGNWAWDGDESASNVAMTANAYERPQCSACFIQGVPDDLMGIYDLLKSEARLFKYGSGTGSNFSNIRGRQEKLSGGGTSSGLMSFLEVFDRAAGSTKSGGTTRRAAKMVCLDMDHPEIVDFIEWKSREEKKAHALIAGGYSADFNGEAYHTISGQNSNNSLRITDAFIGAAMAGDSWQTRMRTTGAVCETLDAKVLWNKVATAAWACADPGVQYDTTINKWHTCSNSGAINASNPCSEYMFLDDTACNLSSVNLTKFLREQSATEFFDVEGYRHACRIFFIAQEILVDLSSYPTENIARNSHDFRPLGLGYANLGSLLMQIGVPYDSPQGRGIAGALTAIMCGHAYRASAEMAQSKGAFNGFVKNREPMLRVMGMHRDAAHALDRATCPLPLYKAACEDWDLAVQLGEKHGYRNAQATVLAPTGTIGLLMDCDTTGVEPDFALVKFKKLAGGGYFKIVNQSVPEALRRLGYGEREVREIVAYVSGSNSLLAAPHINTRTLKERGLTDADLAKVEAALPSVFDIGSAFAAWIVGDAAYERVGASLEKRTKKGFSLLEHLGFTRAEIGAASEVAVGRMTIEGAPYLRPQHYPVFDCANRCGSLGQRYLAPMSHVKMMAAVQPFLSGAISKTVNLPNDATVDEVREVYEEGWRLGLKAVALYRDGCKASQPLSTSSKEKDQADQDAKEERIAAADEHELSPVPRTSAPQDPTQLALNLQTEHAAGKRPKGLRVRLPKKRVGFTQEARVGGHKIFLRTGQYEDGSLGEIFIDMHKEGAAFRSLMNCFAMSVSIGLQYGVPLETYVEQFTFTRFEPQGVVEGHPYVKISTSIVDYLFRVLGVEYLHRYDLAHVKPDEAPSSVGFLGSTHDKHEQAATPFYPTDLGSRERESTDGSQSLSHTRAAVARSAQMNEGLGSTQFDGPNHRHGSNALDAHLDAMMGDAPVCDVCGHITVRNGACYKCLNCGNSLGCS